MRTGFCARRVRQSDYDVTPTATEVKPRAIRGGGPSSRRIFSGACSDELRGSRVSSGEVPFSEALRTWTRIALLSFGGPAGQIALMHRVLVEEKRWISEERFLHALNYCMLLPGPEAQQLATYVGWLMHGTRGGLAAGTLFILPGFLAIMVFSVLYVTLGHHPFVSGIFLGLKAAVVALVIQAVFRVGRRALRNRLSLTIAVLAFLSLALLAIPFPLIILAAAILWLFLDARRAPRVTVCLGAWCEHDGSVFHSRAHSMRSPVANSVATHRQVAGDRLALMARPGRCAHRVGRTGACADASRRVLQSNGGRYLWRRLRSTDLRSATGCGSLWMGLTGTDARWSGPCGVDTWPADHGRTVRGLPRGLSGARRFACSRRGGRVPHGMGDVRALLSRGSFSGRLTSNHCARIRR